MKKLTESLRDPVSLSFRLTILLGIVVITYLVTATIASAEAAPDPIPETPATSLAAATADEPPSDLLPTTAGIGIHKINKYSMVYSRSYYDAELNSTVLVFKLSDAGRLEALMDYCCPSYRLAEELAALKEDYESSGDYVRSMLNVQDILNELLVNAGGGPNYHYVPIDELIATAEEVIETEEFQRFVEVTKPLAEYKQFVGAAEPLAERQKADARSLMSTFTEEELAEICENLREYAYGEWRLRLRWLDEMEFSVMVPANAGIEEIFQSIDTQPANAPAA